jgi:thiol-disulfide isomerase/thioredoxin
LIFQELVGGMKSAEADREAVATAPSAAQALHHMRAAGFVFAAFAFLAASARADVVADVRASVASGRWDAAHQLIEAARAQGPQSPTVLEALSWLARGELAAQRLDQAKTDANATRVAATALLRTRALDDEPRLPIALGAAIEVEAQVLAARGERTAAIAQLQQDHARYADTSIATRIQKNLNLLALVGQLAPPLVSEPHFGRVVPALAALKGKPVLMFFWAHWCGDCKAMAPAIARVATELRSRGLVLVAPTQTYGDADEAEAERRHIDDVRQHFYADLGDAPVPVSAANFKSYGASTVPTIVLVDRVGKVALYHPGLMTYDELAARAVAASR